GHDVALMAVDNVGLLELTDEGERQRVASLAAHVPGFADYADAQSTHHLVTIPVTEGHQRRWHFVRHVPREFEGISLGPTGHAVVIPKQRRHDVNDARPTVGPPGPHAGFPSP